MKKILFVSNHLQSGDGVCRTLTTLVNALAETNEYDITISFMLRFDKSLLPLFDKRIKIRHAFHLSCFKGLDRLMSYLPGKFLYRKVSKKEKYDIEVGYCWRNPTIAISNSTNKEAKHILFTHGFVSAKKLYLKNDALLGCSSESVNLLKEDVQNAIPIFHFPNIFNEQDILNYADESPVN